MSVPEVTLSGDALYGASPTPLPMQLMAQLPTAVKLGRIRPAARPMALNLAEYLDLSALTVALPASTNRREKAAKALARMYLNDRQGCCVISGKYHALGLWSGVDAGNAIEGTDAEINTAYHTICGPGDNGCYIPAVLNYLRDHGLPFNGVPHKIDGYVQADWTRQDVVKAAQYLFGATTIGINLPEDWTRKAVWDVTESRIVGGHDVTPIDYDDQGVYVSSWGRVYLITWAAFTSRRWIEEYYILLGPDWYNSDRLSPAGVDVAQLRLDLAKLGGGTIPPIDPPPAPPVPPPVPPPTPPPVPVPTALSITLEGNFPTMLGHERVQLTGRAVPALAGGLLGGVNYLAVVFDVAQLLADIRAQKPLAVLTADAMKLLSDLGIQLPPITL